MCAALSACARTFKMLGLTENNGCKSCTTVQCTLCSVQCAIDGFFLFHSDDNCHRLLRCFSFSISGKK